MRPICSRVEEVSSNGRTSPMTKDDAFQVFHINFFGGTYSKVVYYDCFFLQCQF